MKVWLLIEEVDAVDQDRYVIGVYTSEELARLAEADARETARKDGQSVYGDTDEDGEEDPNWDIDYSVESHTVEGA